MADLSSVTPTWINPINGADRYFVEISESESFNKEYFLLSNTPTRQYELSFLGLSDEQYLNLLTHYRGVSGEYAGFYWKSISPQFYSLLGEDLSPRKITDLIGDNHLDVTGAISCKGKGGERWGMQFDGINDYLMPNPSSTTTVFNFDFYQNFAISLWIKIPSSGLYDPTVNTNKRLIDKYDATAHPFSIYINSTNNIIYFRRGDGSVNPTVNSTSTFNDDRWHHIVAVRGTSSGASLMYLYVDSSLQDSDTDSTTTTTTNSNDFIVGALSTTKSTYLLTGSLDEIRIYNIELSAASVALLYAGTTTLTNCVAAWDFNDVSMYGRWIGQMETKVNARNYDVKLNFEKCSV